MTTLTVDPSRVRFPARCARCGTGGPSRAVTLETFRGWDLLYVRWGKTCEVRLPLCERCWRRRWALRVGWMTAVLATVIAPAAAMAGLLALLGPQAEPWLVAPTMLIMLGLLFLARLRERVLFQRVASPVWLRRFRPQLDRVDLCFRSDVLARDVGLLSGIAAPPGEVGYRQAAGAPPPEPWVGARRRQIPWWAPLGLGLTSFVIAGVEFAQYAEHERTGQALSDQALVILLYQVGGKYAVLGMFVFAGGLLCSLGVVMRLRRRTLHQLAEDLMHAARRAGERRRRR